jgi:hypothetical protein
MENLSVIPIAEDKPPPPPLQGDCRIFFFWGGGGEIHSVMGNFRGKNY